MLLLPQDGLLFFKLHRAFMFFVNERLQVLPDQPATPDEFSGLAPEKRFLVREAWLKNKTKAHAEIEAFLSANPFEFAPDELEIVSSWRHYVAGQFIAFRQLSRHAVFLTTDEPTRAYGVVALAEPVEHIMGRPLPVMTQTVLLPFRDVIVYDGLLSSMNVYFGPGIRRSFNETYQKAKSRGIITRLPAAQTGQEPMSSKVQKTKRRKSPPRRAPGDVNDVLKIVTGLTDQFCRDCLNDEYAELCRQLAQKLARKRPSPLLSGKPNAWACGIVRTIGRVNFLGDPKQDPHVRTPQIDEAFQVSQATASARAKAICDLLDIVPLDPAWTLPSRLESNPLVWMFKVNGLLMDLRHAPRGAQVAAFEQGLIPYIPADRAEIEH